MEISKKPVAESATATSPENLSQQEITIENAEKATTEETTEKDGLLAAKQAREIEELMAKNEALNFKVKEHAKLQKAHRKLKRKNLESDDFANYLIDQLKNVK